jgi:hypothetical protein
MAQGFPTYTKTGSQGEIGVALVTREIGKLGWIFRRNHNEHDFGIDGYIDLVGAAGAVTGRMLAVQIKCGHSYLSHQNQYGFTYYGESKHLNYLLNHPMPVILIICDPDNEICYWEHFDEAVVEPTQAAWKVNIPNRNTLTEALRSELEAIAGQPIDYSPHLDEYWKFKKELSESSVIVCPIDRASHIEPIDGADIVNLFNTLTRTDAFAIANQGKVELWFMGYDEDLREIWEIPEVRAFLKYLEPVCKYWFFFLRSEKPTYGLPIFVYSLCNAERVGGESGSTVSLRLDMGEFNQLLVRNYCWLNEIAGRLQVSEAEIERVSRAVIECVGFQLPAKDG